MKHVFSMLFQSSQISTINLLLISKSSLCPLFNPQQFDLEASTSNAWSIPYLASIGIGSFFWLHWWWCQSSSLFRGIMSWPPGYIHDDDDGGHNCNVGDAARHPGCCYFLNEFFQNWGCCAVAGLAIHSGHFHLLENLEIRGERNHMLSTYF